MVMAETVIACAMALAFAVVAPVTALATAAATDGAEDGTAWTTDLTTAEIRLFAMSIVLAEPSVGISAINVVVAKVVILAASAGAAVAMVPTTDCKDSTLVVITAD